MKRQFLILLLSVSGGAVPLVPEITEYRQCVSSLVELRDRFDRFIPGWFRERDRRFHHMRHGISVIDANSRLIEGMSEINPTVPLSGHLIGNAIEDCRAYHAQFRTYAIWSTAAVYLGMATTLLLMYFAVFRGKQRADEPQHPEKNRRAS